MSTQVARYTGPPISPGADHEITLANSQLTTDQHNAASWQLDVRETGGTLMFSLTSDDDEIVVTEFEDENEDPITGITVTFPRAKTSLLDDLSTYEVDIVAVLDGDRIVYLLRSTLSTDKLITQVS